METINKVVETAKGVLYGNEATTETHQSTREEPLSGQTGDVRHGEPYDAGNQTSEGATTTSTDPTSLSSSGRQPSGGRIVPTSTDANRSAAFNVNRDVSTGPTVGTSPRINPTKPSISQTSSHTSLPQSSYDESSSFGNLPPTQGKKDEATLGGGQHSGGQTNTFIGDSAPGNTLLTQPVRPEHETDKTGVTSHHQNQTNFIGGDGVGAPSSSNEPTTAGAQPSISSKPITGDGGHSGAGYPGKNQGADAPLTQPESHHHEAIRETKRNAERVQDEGGPNQHPGQLKEAHSQEHDDNDQAGSAPGAGGGGPRQGSLTGHLPGVPGGEGLQKTSKGTGTGTEYVKSSGLVAEGGDFDASKPGAGREADRLLEEKGISHGEKKKDPVGGETDHSHHTEGHSKTGGLHGMKDKVKHILHKS